MMLVLQLSVHISSCQLSLIRSHVLSIGQLHVVPAIHLTARLVIRRLRDSL